MMEELQWKKTSRKGYRFHLMCLMHKVDPFNKSEERLSQKLIANVRSSIEQFAEQGALLRDIDKDIVATIQAEDKLEAEVVESAVIQEVISDKISLIKSVLNSLTTSTLSASTLVFVPSGGLHQHITSTNTSCK